MKTRLVVCACLLATVACDNSSSNSTSTSPSASVVTETFAGSVDVAGSAFHPFTVALSGGQVNVILTAAGPPSTIFMGLGIGTYSNSTCTLLSGGSVVTQAGATAQLSGTVNAGSYCVMVYDVGNQTAAVAYALTVTHY